jgi:hypothetical protein
VGRDGTRKENNYTHAGPTLNMQNAEGADVSRTPRENPQEKRPKRKTSKY